MTFRTNPQLKSLIKPRIAIDIMKVATKCFIREMMKSIFRALTANS